MTNYDNSTMRQFTQDQKIQALIDIVEKQLGYPIRALQLTEAEFRRLRCGIQRHSEKLTFRYYPGAIYSSEELCHELMHITLYIEGWPFMLVERDLQKTHGAQFMEEIIANLFQHIEVWQRGITLGYSEYEMWDKDIEQRLIPLVINKSLAHTVSGPALRESCQALCLAQALLSPASRASRNRLKQVARKNLPGALEQAETIRRVCGEYGQSFPKSLEAALQKVLSIARMPQETLLCEFPSTASPDFFVHLQQEIHPAYNDPT